MRLAIFVDQVFWRDGDVLSTDEPYILFPASFAEAVEEIIFIGREAPDRRRAPYVLDHPAIRFCSLPYYPSLHQVWRAHPRVYGEIRRRIRSHARNWDAVLIGGPNPIGQLVARECSTLGIPVVLIVRQNLVEQMSTNRGLKRFAAMAAAWVLEWDFRRLARGRTVFTVGMEMAREYLRVSERVHNHFPCLVNEAQFRAFSNMTTGTDATRLLCIGRLSPEKGHKYLFQAILQLKSRGLECHVDVVGSGPLEQELKDQVVDFGLAEQITFHGYVPHGPALFELFQQAGALVLTSLTEGFPQVINESLCMGLPTIASAVGGIPAFLTNGETALLTPRGDVDALARAVERIVRDGKLREHLRRNGRALMSNNTLETNRALVLGVLQNEVLFKPA